MSRELIHSISCEQKLHAEASSQPPSPPLRLQQQFKACLDKDCKQHSLLPLHQQASKNGLFSVEEEMCCSEEPEEPEAPEEITDIVANPLCAVLQQTGETLFSSLIARRIAHSMEAYSGEQLLTAVCRGNNLSALQTKGMFSQRLTALQLQGYYENNQVLIQRRGDTQLTYTLLNGPLSGLTIHAALVSGNGIRLTLLAVDRQQQQELQKRRDILRKTLDQYGKRISLDIPHVAALSV